MGESFVCINGLDLEAGLDVYNRYRNGSRDFDDSPDMVEQLVAAALGECIPATVEGGELRMPEDDGNTAPLSLVERFVSAWQPVRTDSE